MFDVFSTLWWSLSCLFWYIIVPYVLYERIFCMYEAYHFYGSQSIMKTVGFPIPFFGNLI